MSMELIDKAALIAEINKRIVDAPINNIGHQRVWTYNDVKDIIDTLEVKDPWKPTDEQLEALEWSLGDYRNVIFEERHDTLVSLYNNLKKLKGE